MGDLKKILFVCMGNTCRSQMAEGFAKALGAKKAVVRSAGLSAAGSVNRPTVEAMAEKGIDISGHTSDQITFEMVEWADIIVSMAGVPCSQFCPPSYKGLKYDWQIPDPLGRPWEFMRKVRDDIEARVKGLIDEHGKK